MHLTHYRQSAAGVGSHLDYIGLVEDARDQGMDVTFDCYTYHTRVPRRPSAYRIGPKTAARSG